MAGGGTGCSAGRRSALTRRYVGVDDGFVNCGSSRRYVWPVLAPAEGIVRAGGWSAGAGRLSRGAVFVLCRSCDSIGMSCVCSRPSCVPFGMSCVCSRPSCVPLGISCVRSRLLFAAWRQTGRLAGCSVPVPPWVVIAIRAFSRVIRLSGLVSSLRACTFLYGDPDGEREDGETRGTESAARRRYIFA